MYRIAIFIALTSLSPAPLAGAQSMVELKAKGGFAEVKQLLIIAIENQGLVVDHVSTVGDMLERTGRDLGATTKIYERAEVLQFCSANYSRKMMEADARLLAFCPFTIAIYTLPGEPGLVHLVYRHIQAEGVSTGAAEALRQIDELLQTIVEEAAE